MGELAMLAMFLYLRTKLALEHETQRLFEKSLC